MRFALDRSLSLRIVKLAYPVTLAMLTQTAINLVDTIMVGRLPVHYSIAGQSAIGYSLILLWALGGFLCAIQVGTQAITARRYGEGLPLKSGEALTNSLVIAFICGVVVSVTAYLMMDWIFPLFDSNPNVVRIGTEYAGYRVLGVLSMVATASYKSFFDGIGKTHVHMVAAIVMNIANVLLNWVLIFGVGPFPELFVGGAGIGSLISTYIGLAVMMGWSGLAKYRLNFFYYRWSNLNWRVTYDIIRVSVPGGLATVFVMSGFGLFIKIVGMLDARLAQEALVAGAFYDGSIIDVMRQVEHMTLAVDPAVNAAVHRPPYFTSATKIIMDIMSLSFMSMIALGTATATLVGQSLGAKNLKLASRFGWESVRIGVYLMAVFAAFTIGYTDWFVTLFNPDPQVVLAARTPMRLMAISTVGIAVGMVLAQALFGAGYSRYVMWVEAVLHVVCLVPLSYLMGLVFDMGLVGIWYAAALYIGLLAIAMAWKFHEGAWQKVVL